MTRTNSPTVAADRGYAHPAYARSLKEFGTPVRLTESGGSVLERRIPGTDHVDAMGPYPLFVCGDWDSLYQDLERYTGRWVSVAGIVDPFGASQDDLEAQGFEVVRTYKSHYLIDLSIPYTDAVSSRHQEYARHARQNGVEVRQVTDPEAKLSVWCDLYDNLIDRHDITGIQAFSQSVFEKQFRVPGLVMFYAEHEGKPAAAHLWYEMGDVAYSHLVAHSTVGYETRASYALHEAAIRHFADRLQWLDIGGGKEGAPDSEDGLSQFKRRWATTTCPSLLWGRILQPSVYRDLITSSDNQKTDYFPAYRNGELT